MPEDREQLIAIVALRRRPWSSNRGVAEAIARHGSASAAAGATLAPANIARTRADVERLEAQGVRLLGPADPDYPVALGRSADPPLALFVRGTLVRHDDLAVAVVGSRRATPEGRRIARALGEGLAALGITVVSGLARGIDAEAHRGALAAPGRTLAVLGSGIDVVYPPEHCRLAAEVARAGAVLSELAPGEPPRRHHFPARNRILAALVRAVVVVEAAARSGSLITARLAIDEGRSVLAVPGSPLSPAHRGSNRLIQEGATLLADLADLVAELPAEARARLVRPRVKQRTGATDEEGEVLAALAADEARHVDEVAERLGQPLAMVTSALLALELEGRVARVAGGRYVKLRSLVPWAQQPAAAGDAPLGVVLSSNVSEPHGA